MFEGHFPYGWLTQALEACVCVLILAVGAAGCVGGALVLVATYAHAAILVVRVDASQQLGVLSTCGRTTWVAMDCLGGVPDGTGDSCTAYRALTLVRAACSR